MTSVSDALQTLFLRVTAFTAVVAMVGARETAVAVAAAAASVH